VLRDVADVTAVARAVGELETGTLDIVALPTLAADPLAAMIGEFRIRHPGVTIRLGEPEDGASIERQVEAGRAELGITDLLTAGSSLVRVELFRQEMCVVCPPTTLLPDGPVTAQTLAAMPLIATPPGTSTRRLLDRLTARNEPNIVVEVHHRDAILPLVLAGAGAALLPEPMARDAAARGSLVRSLRPALTRRIGVVHRRAAVSPAAAAMIALMQER
jgi:DNA-binding transcriptional LysR family regulator